MVSQCGSKVVGVFKLREPLCYAWAAARRLDAQAADGPSGFLEGALERQRGMA